MRSTSASTLAHRSAQGENQRVSMPRLLPRIPLAAIGLMFLVFSCQKGRWSKEWEDKFETFQPSGKIMNVIGVKAGMTVGEIGAGNGRFAVKMAAKVGPSGKVYANDIDDKAIRFMKKRCEREQITNMTVIHSGEVEPGFPAGELDLVYLINTYDHLVDPITLLRNTRSSLKPDGRLAVIAYDPKRLHDHRGHAVPRKRLISECTRAGFELVHLDSTLIYDNIYLFKKST
jgi:2-polyprenyl-3-methyl-5-hydroxy-6-metoxy-1,4-benzoquinol methylase